MVWGRTSVTAVAAIALMTVFATGSQAYALSGQLEPRQAEPAQMSPDVQMQMAGVLTVNYHYDSLGRLILETYPANTATYSYDAAGNRTQTETY